jgi:3-oxoacyl-[acyl-carrier protein] reductase
MPSLQDKVALVAGGGGHIGEGVVRAFLERGARVAVPSREEDKLVALRKRLGPLGGERLLTLTGEVAKPEEAERVRAEVERALGPLDAVVASVGGWWQGPPLTQVPVETWHRVLDNNLTSHFILARAFLPGLSRRAGSSYTLINGTAAEEAVARSGLASIAAAANLMLARVLIAEHKGTPVRINALVLGSIHTRRVPDAPPEWLTPDEVGTFCAYLASEEGRMVSGGVHHLVERPVLPPH